MVLCCPGLLIPCYSCHLAADQQQSTSKSHQQHSTAINSYQPHFEMHQELGLSGYTNADTPSAELVKWQKEEQQPSPTSQTHNKTHVCFFAVHVPVDSFGGIRFKLESTHFFQGVPVEISGGHIGIWLRLLLRNFNSMLPTLPLWQAAHGFGSEPNKNSHSMALKVKLQQKFCSL